MSDNNKENYRAGSGKGLVILQQMSAVGKPYEEIQPAAEKAGRNFVLESVTTGTVNVQLFGEDTPSLKPVFAGKTHFWDIEEIFAGGTVPLSDLWFGW